MTDQTTHIQQKEAPAPAEKASVQSARPVSSTLSNPLSVYGSRISSPDDIPLTPENILYLQRTVGNQVVTQLIQAKLKIGQPDDEYEREADQVAEQVMRMPEPDTTVPGSNQTVGEQIHRVQREQLHRQPEDEEQRKRLEEETIQRQSLNEDEQRKRPEEEEETAKEEYPLNSQNVETQSVVEEPLDDTNSDELGQDELKTEESPDVDQKTEKENKESEDQEKEPEDKELEISSEAAVDGGDGIESAEESLPEPLGAESSEELSSGQLESTLAIELELLSTGDLALIDEELAEHQRWAGALGRVGDAGSLERAEFISESAGGGFLKGFGMGAAMGLAMGVAGRLATKFVPIPGVGAILGGSMAIYGLATRDWEETGAIVSRFGEGSSTYEMLANSIASVSEVIDVVSNVLSAINTIVGILQFVVYGLIAAAAVAAFFTFGATAGFIPVLISIQEVLTSIALGINIVTTILDSVNAGILQPCVLLFRALHTFTTEADPRDVEAQGYHISRAASASGAALGAWAGGKLAEIGAPKPQADTTQETHDTQAEAPPTAADGDGPTVTYEPANVDDILTFAHTQAGFEAGAELPPTFDPKSASPFGTRAHKKATTVISELQNIYPEAQKIISEPVIVEGQIQSTGGSPGRAPKGAHAPDYIVTDLPTSGGVGENVSEIGSKIGDLKYGGGEISQKYDIYGLPLETQKGQTQALPESPPPGGYYDFRLGPEFDKLGLPPENIIPQPPVTSGQSSQQSTNKPSSGQFSMFPYAYQGARGLLRQSGEEATPYEQRQAAHRARSTADNQPMEGVERVNPNYADPPGTPGQLEAIKNEILNLLATRAIAEQAEQQMEQQVQTHEATQEPIQGSVDETTGAITASQAHQQAVANRFQANMEQQQRQQGSQELIAGYPSQATGLVALTIPLAAFERFTHYASKLPGDAGEKMLKMNNDAKEMQAAFKEMGSAMINQNEKQPERQQKLQNDQKRIETTQQEAKTSEQNLTLANEGAMGLQQATNSKIIEASIAKEEATTQKVELDEAVTQKEQQGKTLAEQLHTWAIAHQIARQEAIQETIKYLEAEEYIIKNAKEY